MTHAVVIGIFENKDVAQMALKSLGDAGFGIDQVDLTFDSASVLTKIKEYQQLSDEDKMDLERFKLTVRDAAAVTVVTDSIAQAEQAVEVLDNAGAIDIDERVRLLRSDNEPIPYAEEKLHVSKQGGPHQIVRTRSRIVQPPVEHSS
jgi:hypothetical protein